MRKTSRVLGFIFLGFVVIAAFYGFIPMESMADYQRENILILGVICGYCALGAFYYRPWKLSFLRRARKNRLQCVV